MVLLRFCRNEQWTNNNSYNLSFLSSNQTAASDTDTASTAPFFMGW